jgi:adenine-specific DNA-methyltransferase
MSADNKTTANDALLSNQYLEKIEKIPVASFNREQKEVAKRIIENTPKEDLDKVYNLITQRVKTGFVFDCAPEVSHNCIALVEENKELFIKSDSFALAGNVATEHSLIIGENYDALKNLCATYIDTNGNGLIDVIYIDPPYNTESAKGEGNDYKEEVAASKFIYRDKFTRDGWLNMMNERLKLAQKLLSDKGVIFISIDDSQQAYLKVLCDEVFGEENNIGNIIWLKGNAQNDAHNL